MARKTSFYYSFLVLPAEQRRAIIAVWDFCRAVDDAVDEEPAAAGGAAGRPRGGRVLARRSWRAASTAATPQTPQGRAAAAVHRGVRSAAPGVRGRHRRRRDGSRHDALPDLRRSVRVLPPRRVGGRHDLHPDLRLPRAQRAREYALNLGVALQLTNILRDVKDDLARGRVYLPLEDLAAHGCTVDDLAAGVVTEPVRRADRVRVPARARLLSARDRRAAARGSPPAGRRRDHARGVLRNAAAHRAQRLRRVLRRVRACRGRVQALIALQTMAAGRHEPLRRRSSSAPGSPA